MQLRAALVLLLLLPAQAGASADALLLDCTDDERLSRSYAQADYRKALEQLATDSDQYGNCREVIRNAARAAATDSAGRAGHRRAETRGAVTPELAGGPPQKTADEALSAANPAEREQVRELQRGEAAPTIRAQSAAPVATRNSLPTSLVVVLVAGGLLAMVPVVRQLRARR